MRLHPPRAIRTKRQAHAFAGLIILVVRLRRSHHIDIASVAQFDKRYKAINLLAILAEVQDAIANVVNDAAIFGVTSE